MRAKILPTSFLTAVVTVTTVLAVLPLGTLRATDYLQLGIGELVATSDLIVSAELAPAGDMLEVRPGEVLKGAVPGAFKMRGKALFAREKQTEINWDEPSDDDDVLLDEDASKNHWIVFLWNGERYHPGCLQPESMKQRVLEVLAMEKDPAPFVRSGKHDEDRDLVFLLGERFRAFRIEGVADRGAYHQEEGSTGEELKESLVYQLLAEDEVPWEPVRLTISFTYDPDRKPPLLTDGFNAQGAIADFIRKKESTSSYRENTFGKGGKLPPRFSVTLDTRGPEKVGGLTRAEATAFLISRLGLEDEEVAREAHKALVKMRDSDAVTAAIGILKQENPHLPSRALQLLGKTKDPRMLEKIGAALDALSEEADGDKDTNNRRMQTLVRLLPEGPGKLPVLRRAMTKGYSGILIASAVAENGNEEDFELLLASLRNPAAIPQTKPLATMVKRSNHKTEEWMNDLGTGESQGQDALRERWLNWWEANKNDFKIAD